MLTEWCISLHLARSELSNLFENSKRKDELKVSLSLRMSGTSQGEVHPLSPDENLLSLMQRLWVACDVDPKQARSRKNWDSSISYVSFSYSICVRSFVV